MPTHSYAVAIQRGKVFDFKAEAELILLTLQHIFTDPSKTKPLIHTQRPRMLKHCRIEQRWNKSVAPSPLSTTILATDSINLSHTEIEATNGCAILSKLQADSPDNMTIRLEECAIAAVRGFYLMSP